jgi:hypothetical protein
MMDDQRSPKSFPNLIRQAKEIQKDLRKDGKTNSQFNHNLTIIYYKNISLLKYSTLVTGTASDITISTK